MMARQRMQAARADRASSLVERTWAGGVALNYRGDFGPPRCAHAVVRRARGGRYGLAPWRIRAPRPRPRSRGRAPMRFGGLFRERSFYQSRAARGAYRGLRRGFGKA